MLYYSSLPGEITFLFVDGKIMYLQGKMLHFCQSLMSNIARHIIALSCGEVRTLGLCTPRLVLMFFTLRLR